MSREQTVRDYAQQYAALGYTIVKYDAGAAAPSGTGAKGWQKRRDDPLDFDGSHNIGIRHGQMSGNLIDIDCDTPNARELARIAFAGAPHYGRKSNPSSHWLVRCPDLPSEKATVSFDVGKAGQAAINLQPKSKVVELLASGQSTAPPSLHKSGELVEWEDIEEGVIPPPLQMSYAEIVRRAAAVAVCSVAAHRWPEQGSRHDTSLALLGVLCRMGLDPELVDKLVVKTAELGGDDEATRRGGAKSTAEKLEKDEPVTGMPALIDLLDVEALKKALRQWQKLAMPADKEERGIYLGNDVYVLNNAVFAAVRDDLVGQIFLRGGEFVVIKRVADGITEEVVTLERVCPDLLEYRLAERGVYFFKVDTNGEPYRVRPRGALKPVCNLAHLSGVDEVRAILRGPSLTRSEPGYDREAKMYLDFDPAKFPPPYADWTRELAEAGLRWLTYLLREFPFEYGDQITLGDQSSVSRSAALSAILTGVARPFLTTAPMHAASAMSPGTGKTYLIHLISRIVSDRLPSNMSWRGTEEDAKEIVSKLRAGVQVIHIENLKRFLDSAELATILTSQAYEPRLLGEHTTLRLPTQTLVLACGNNFRMHEEICRRTIQVVLNAGVERPHDRQFSFDPMQEVRRRRGWFYFAALTILRAYIAAGKPLPQDFKMLGSFEEWSHLVRGALVWLGEPDPILAQPDATEVDYDRQELESILDGIKEVFGFNRRFTAEDTKPNSGFSNPAFNGVRTAIVATLKDKKGADRDDATVTRTLRKYVKQPLNGMVLKSESRRTNQRRTTEFWLEAVK